MTPAEELRAAADALRLQAKLATDGPWTCSPVWSPDGTATSGVYSRAHRTGTVASEVVASGRVRLGSGGIRNPHNAVWITLMQPAVAEPLAVLLDDLAQFTSLVESEPPPGHVAGKALALARVINGSAS